MERSSVVNDFAECWARRLDLEWLTSRLLANHYKLITDSFQYGVGPGVSISSNVNLSFVANCTLLCL